MSHADTYKDAAMNTDEPLRQTAFTIADDDDLMIIGASRDAAPPQTHSTFRKIDMAAKAGRLLSFSWGDLMVMLPRTLYDQIYDYVTRPDHDSRAMAIIEILEEGLAACSD